MTNLENSDVRSAMVEVACLVHDRTYASMAKVRDKYIGTGNVITDPFMIAAEVIDSFLQSDIFPYSWEYDDIMKARHLEVGDR